MSKKCKGGGGGSKGREGKAKGVGFSAAIVTNALLIGCS